MAVRNLNYLMALLALRSEIIHTLDQLKAHPLTQTYVPLFEGLRDDWSAIFAEELALRDKASAANARIVAVDTTLNMLAGNVSKALLKLTGDDRTHPLYIAYFKKKSLSDFKRPILGAQLSAMRGWIPELKGSDMPALLELGKEVEAAVAEADLALSERAAVETESTFFRETGNRKKHLDKVNAARKQLHGELSKMPHERVGLPASFADIFFRHDSASEEEKPQTLEAIEEELARLSRKTAELEALRKALEAENARQAKEAADKVARQNAVIELEREAAETARKLAEARAELAGA